MQKKKFVILVKTEVVRDGYVEEKLQSIHKTMNGARLKSIELEKTGEYDSVFLERADLND